MAVRPMSPSELVKRATQILKRFDSLDSAHAEAQRTLATRACLAYAAERRGDTTGLLLALAERARSADERTEWFDLAAALPLPRWAQAEEPLCDVNRKQLELM